MKSATESALRPGVCTTGMPRVGAGDQVDVDRSAAGGGDQAHDGSASSTAASTCSISVTSSCAPGRGGHERVAVEHPARVTPQPARDDVVAERRQPALALVGELGRDQCAHAVSLAPVPRPAAAGTTRTGGPRRGAGP